MLRTYLLGLLTIFFINQAAKTECDAEHHHEDVSPRTVLNFFAMGGFSRSARFLCSRCGKPLVRCPHCGAMTHVRDLPQNFGNPGGVAGIPQGHSPSNMAGPHPQQQQFSQASTGRSPSSLISNIGNAVGNALGFGGSSPSGEAPSKDILFHLKTYSGEPSTCNGVGIDKEELGGGACRFLMLTARHCVQKLADITRDPVAFGMNYVKEFIIGEHRLTPERIEDSLMLGVGIDSDVVATAMKGACEAITEIASVGATPANGASLQSRKSQFWDTPGMRFVDRAGRLLSKAWAASRPLFGAVSPALEAGYLAFNIANGTTEPGDSGMPIYDANGAVVALLSFGSGAPPFSQIQVSNAGDLRAFAEAASQKFGFKQ